MVFKPFFYLSILKAPQVLEDPVTDIPVESAFAVGAYIVCNYARIANTEIFHWIESMMCSSKYHPPVISTS